MNSVPSNSLHGAAERSSHRSIRLHMLLAAVLLLPAAYPALLSAQVIYEHDFDEATDVDDWTVASPIHSSRSFDANEDVSDDPLSGAMRMSNAADILNLSAQFSLCIDSADPGQVFEADLAARIPLGQSESGSLFLRMNALPEPNCAGSSIAELGTSLQLSTPSDSWTNLHVLAERVPAGAQSVILRVLLNKPSNTGSLEALLDDVLVERIDIFDDGFESGGTTQWSSP